MKFSLLFSSVSSVVSEVDVRIMFLVVEVYHDTYYYFHY